ncbi:hypothetical protein HKX48_005077, partial [Thoreauomyces humboldtii]
MQLDTVSRIAIIWAGLCSTTAALKILVVGDSDKSNQPYVQLAWTGCPLAVAAYGNPATDTCEYVYRSATSTAGYLDNLRYFLNGTYGTYDHFALISSNYGKQVPNCITEFPSVYITSSSSSFGTGKEYARVQGAIFAEDESGMLAGALAGLVTTSKIVGVVAGQPLASVQRYSNGYLMGVQLTCPGCRVLRTFATSFSSVPQGQAIAQSFLTLGADVVFGAGGNTGSYGIQYAAKQGAYVIGVDSDEGLALPFSNSSDPSSPYILSSAMKRVDQSVMLSLKDRLQGNFVQTNRIMDATAGGVALAPWRSAQAIALMARIVPLIVKATADSCAVTFYRTCADQLATIKQQLEGKAISTQIDSTGSFVATSQATLRTEESDWVSLGGVFGMAPPDLESHTMVYLPGTNHAVLYGGETGTGAFSPLTYLFDYDYRQWTILRNASFPTTPAPRIQHVSVALNSNTVLIQGGLSSVGGNATLSDMWILNVDTQIWTQLTPAGSLDLRLSGHSASVVDGIVYIFGGVTADQKLSSALYTVAVGTGATATVSQVLPSTPTAYWPVAREFASLTTINSTHIALFGGAISSGPINSLTILALDIMTWIPVSPSGTAPAVEGHASVLLDSHRILYIGGRTATEASASTFIFNTVQNKWVFTESADLPIGTNIPTAVVMTQSATSNACAAVELASAYLCTPNTRPLVFVYGGSQQ